MQLKQDPTLILDQLMREAIILAGEDNPELIQTHFENLVSALRTIDCALDD